MWSISFESEGRGYLNLYMEENPELNYHKDNEEYLTNIMTEITMITGRGE